MKLKNLRQLAVAGLSALTFATSQAPAQESPKNRTDGPTSADLIAAAASSRKMYDAPQPGMDCSEIVTSSKAKVEEPKAAAKKPAAKRVTKPKVVKPPVEKRYPTYADLVRDGIIAAPAKKPVAKKKAVVAQPKVAAPAKTVKELLSPKSQWSCARPGGGGGGDILSFGPAPVEPIIPMEPLIPGGGSSTPIDTPFVPHKPYDPVTGRPCDTFNYCSTPWNPPWESWNPPGLPSGPGPGPGPGPNPWTPPPFIDPPIVTTPPVVPSIPEPSTYLLMGAGLAVLAATARRRQANAAKPS